MSVPSSASDSSDGYRAATRATDAACTSARWSHPGGGPSTSGAAAALAAQARLALAAFSRIPEEGVVAERRAGGHGRAGAHAAPAPLLLLHCAR